MYSPLFHPLQILEQAPAVFLGTYSELRSEVERLALVVQRLYGITGAALPPWRSHPVLRRPNRTEPDIPDRYILEYSVIFRNIPNIP